MHGIFEFNRTASRLVMIPFTVGPRSPNGINSQLQAEQLLKEKLKEAPRALATLLSINMEIVLGRSKELKSEMAQDHPEIDDRVAENYALLLAMCEEVYLTITVTLFFK